MLFGKGIQPLTHINIELFLFNANEKKNIIVSVFDNACCELVLSGEVTEFLLRSIGLIWPYNENLACHSLAGKSGIARACLMGG